VRRFSIDIVCRLHWETVEVRHLKVIITVGGDDYRALRDLVGWNGERGTDGWTDGAGRDR